MSLDSLLWAAVGGNRPPNEGSASEAEEEAELKFLFVGGKGGVGKTTSSSAIATLLATRCAKRVLLVSTDPAHSLSDAFRCEFTNVPSSPGVDNLHVMEVDPTDTMKAELSKWAELAEDMSEGNGEARTENDPLAKKIHGFQEWLSGVPGIDEATALSSAIKHVESGEYDIIVFDTAPTGHTLKLLQMPDILQAGIEKLQGWQSTLWGYWEAFKGLQPGAAGVASKRRAHAKEEVAQMLEEYKRGIQKVARMLQDQHRTRFAVVCIAEYLSVSETRRLLRELKNNRVRASHIIVNQLVIEDSLTREQLNELEGLAEIGEMHLNRSLLTKTVHACRLTTARKAIQEKYLDELKACPETEGMLDGICEVPLLPEEVTGNDALRRFGGLMVKDPPKIGGADASGKGAAPSTLYEDDNETWTPQRGDIVLVQGLAKSGQYNGLEGTIVTDLDSETGRYGVKIEFEGKAKTIALQRKNFHFVGKAKKLKMDQDASPSPAPADDGNLVSSETVSKAKKVLEDPEIKAMIAQNPRFADAVQDVMENPMNFMKYLIDPEMSPLLSKAMDKMQQQ